MVGAVNVLRFKLIFHEPSIVPLRPPLINQNQPNSAAWHHQSTHCQFLSRADYMVMAFNIRNQTRKVSSNLQMPSRLTLSANVLAVNHMLSTHICEIVKSIPNILSNEGISINSALINECKCRKEILEVFHPTLITIKKTYKHPCFDCRDSQKRHSSCSHASSDAFPPQLRSLVRVQARK